MALEDGRKVVLCLQFVRCLFRHSPVKELIYVRLGNDVVWVKSFLQDEYGG